MTEHPNAVAVRRSFEAWNSGRLDVLGEYFGEYFTDDAVLHFAGNNAMSGTYRGRDAVMDALARASREGARTLMWRASLPVTTTSSSSFTQPPNGTARPLMSSRHCR